MDSAQVRKNIKYQRKVKGLTQKEMADALFMDERTYSNFERGVKKSIDVKLLLAIAVVLETDVIWFITNAETQKEKSISVEEKLESILSEINGLKELFLSELGAIKKELNAEKKVL